MQLLHQIISKSLSLFGFDNSSLTTQGEITLTTFAKGVDKDTPFQVAAADMTYNIILERSWISDINTVP